MCSRPAFTQPLCLTPCLQSLCSYGMREALSIACGEGLEALWARHQQVEGFRKGLWRPDCGTRSKSGNATLAANIDRLNL